MICYLRSLKGRVIFGLSVGFILFFFLSVVNPYYTPPLIKKNGRNILEKGKDFLAFNYHFNKSLLALLKEDKKNNRLELFQAGWYRPVLLKDLLGSEGDFSRLAEAYEQLALDEFALSLYLQGTNKGEERERTFLEKAGLLYQKSEAWEKSEETYRRLVAQWGDSEYYYYYLGKSCLKLKKGSCGKVNLEKAFSLKTDFSDAYFLRGVIAEKEDNRELAKKMYERAIQAEPLHLEALKALNGLQKN